MNVFLIYDNRNVYILYNFHFKEMFDNNRYAYLHLLIYNNNLIFILFR